MAHHDADIRRFQGKRDVNPGVPETTTSTSLTSTSVTTTSSISSSTLSSESSQTSTTNSLLSSSSSSHPNSYATPIVTQTTGLPFNSTTGIPASSTASGNPPLSPGTSSGEVAGISIATFVFGLLLAILGFWFCMSRRKHSAYDAEGHRSAMSNGGRRHHRGDKQEISPASVQDTLLLDPVDDSTLKSTMAKLNNFIDQHVLSHYHDDPIQISHNQLAQAITDCRSKNSTGGIPANELARLLIDPNSRYNAIRHLIAWVILSHTLLDAQPDACLLPRYIVTFYNAFPPVEKHAGCEEAFQNALAKWRHLGAFLLVPNRSFREDPKLDEAQIRAAIDVNLKILHHVLAPFRINGSNNNTDWEKNLRAIIFSGAELGFTLFSQQSSWIFDWKEYGTAFMVVFPALFEKVEGRTKIRVISEAVVA